MYWGRRYDELQYHSIDWWAREKQVNPLPASAMQCSGELTGRMNVNFRFVEFHWFMRALELDEWQVSNYEPYYLTLLMEAHSRQLSDTQEDMYWLYVEKFWFRMADAMPIPFRSHMVAPMPPPVVE
ncbi:MAG: hypothetical protein GTO63_27050 [Anaerolineae bacterium]|nr:hypothetical protein [Anaerolineae bacterium]NIN98390.1 hypothetical protein [Anaerolineae bacterium]NIQ81305.1 hypothetical protein [Anaerolineae bacterium]